MNAMASHVPDSMTMPRTSTWGTRHVESKARHVEFKARHVEFKTRHVEFEARHAKSKACR